MTLFLEVGRTYVLKNGRTAICLDPEKRWMNRPLPLDANPVLSHLNERWTEAAIADLLVVQPWVKGEGWAAKTPWAAFAVRYERGGGARWIPRALHRSHLDDTPENIAAKQAEESRRAVYREAAYEVDRPAREAAARKAEQERRVAQHERQMQGRRRASIVAALRALGLSPIDSFSNVGVALLLADAEKLLAMVGASDELTLATMAQ